MIRIIFILMLFSLNAFAENRINLLKNSGFEDGTRHWKIFSSKASGAKFSLDTQIKHSGNQALC